MSCDIQPQGTAQASGADIGTARGYQLQGRLQAGDAQAERALALSQQLAAAQAAQRQLAADAAAAQMRADAAATASAALQATLQASLGCAAYSNIIHGHSLVVVTSTPRTLVITRPSIRC